MSLSRSSITGLLGALMLSVSAGHAMAADAPAAPPADPNAPVTHGELPALVKQAIMENPQMLMDAIRKLHDNDQANAMEAQKKAFGEHKDELKDSKDVPTAGNPNGDVTVVEFFDYHCGYCKRFLDSVTELLDKDKKVRVVFRDFPILSDDSKTAAQAAVAAFKIAPTKFFAYHTALMKYSGKFDEAALLDIAEKTGIDKAKLKAEMNKPEIAKIIDENHKIALDLGIRGTPAIIIGDQLIPGAVPYESLQKAIDLTRQQGAHKPKS